MAKVLLKVLRWSDEYFRTNLPAVRLQVALYTPIGTTYLPTPVANALVIHKDRYG